MWNLCSLEAKILFQQANAAYFPLTRLPHTLKVDVLNLKGQPFHVDPPNPSPLPAAPSLLAHAILPSRCELAVGKDSVVLRVQIRWLFMSLLLQATLVNILTHFQPHYNLAHNEIPQTSIGAIRFRDLALLLVCFPGLHESNPVTGSTYNEALVCVLRRWTLCF